MYSKNGICLRPRPRARLEPPALREGLARRDAGWQSPPFDRPFDRPFAWSALLGEEPPVPADWCYCSAGYAKLRFDAAFDREHDVEILESVLAGSDRCRFAIVVPASGG